MTARPRSRADRFSVVVLSSASTRTDPEGMKFDWDRTKGCVPGEICVLQQRKGKKSGPPTSAVILPHELVF